VDEDIPAQKEIERENEYQPLSYDAYKFFTKFTPFIEKVIINNINKHYFQTNPIDLQELKAFSKMNNEFKLSDELINQLGIGNNYKTIFKSNVF
jgi:hypothetical protein